MNKILRNQKPIDIDAHLLYVCKNPNCRYSHWISLKESQTKNFKMVCDCGTIYSPKLIDKIKIIYKKDKVESKENIKAPTTQNKSNPKEIDLELLNKSVQILVGYGFTKIESEQLVRNTYSINPIDNCVLLIKKVLESFGENINGEEHYSSV